jgi:hypothetical protein
MFQDWPVFSEIEHRLIARRKEEEQVAGQDLPKDKSRPKCLRKHIY